MRLIGLTGGIGSGKSTVSAMLAEAGLPVIDADAITHQLQAAGQPVLAAIVDAFGEQILLPDGELDRAQLADRVFTDPDQLATLNAIVHPAVGVEIARQLDELARTPGPVILDVPLLVETGRDDLELLVVVDIDPKTAVSRLVGQRGFSAEDAWARINRQIDRAGRLARADIIIDNNGSREALRDQVDDLLAKLTPRSV